MDEHTSTEKNEKQSNKGSIGPIPYQWDRNAKIYSSNEPVSVLSKRYGLTPQRINAIKRAHKRKLMKMGGEVNGK